MRSTLAETYNVYCDESCHLERDGHAVMVLGALWCPLEGVREASRRIREIKLHHGLSSDFEVKWTKVSPGGLRFYLDIVDYFFDSDRLHFRGLVADKNRLRHGDFGQTHDDWYYKMYFSLLKAILQPGDRFRVYIDIKDTRGAAKIRKLHEVLAYSLYDFPRDIVERLQIVRSQEVELLQLADLLTGILSAANRQPPANLAKGSLIERMRERSRYLLTRTTLISEKKVNIFQWKGAE